MRATVTQLDIKRGKKVNCHECPIARAMSRALGCRVRVYMSTFGVKKKAREYLLPKACVDFVSLFDVGESVKPFSFIFRKPARM